MRNIDGLEGAEAKLGDPEPDSRQNNVCGSTSSRNTYLLLVS